MPADQPPRDPKALLVEMDARLKVRDIREWDRLRREVEIKWWESALLALLFVSGIGVMVTLVQVIPTEPRLLYGFMLAWCGLFGVALIACIEFLVLKFRALRQMNEATLREVEEVQKALRGIREYLEAREQAEG